MLFVGVALAGIAAFVALLVNRFHRAAEIYDNPLPGPFRHVPSADRNSA